MGWWVRVKTGGMRAGLELEVAEGMIWFRGKELQGCLRNGMTRAGRVEKH